MDQRVMNLYENYNQGYLGRREFLRTLTLIAGGAAAAHSLLILLEQNDVKAEIVPSNDTRLHTEHVHYQGSTGDVRAYVARPKEDVKVPGVIVIHEVWGLNAHIEDVTRRLALEGFLGMAPDALSPLGGSPKDPAEARAMTQQLDRSSTVKNYLAAMKYLQTHPASNGNVGVIGFCWGGGMANQLAVNAPDLKAAVPFYGSPPASEEVPKIKASLLLHYAGLDERINQGIPAFEAALKAASIDYRIYMYEGAMHAFHNDANPERYNKEAAQLAWKRTISFLKEKLKT